MAKGDVKPEYDVVQADCVLDLRIQMKMAMEGGWIPLGGVQVVATPEVMYYQAVCRHMEECLMSEI